MGEDGRLLVRGSGWQCSYSNAGHNMLGKLKQHNGLGSMTHLKFSECQVAIQQFGNDVTFTLQLEN